MNAPLSSTDALAAAAELTAVQREILALHCDPQAGSPYWIERCRERGIRSVDELRTWRDLWRLGPMNEQSLSLRPVEDFMPQSLSRTSAQHNGWIRSESGGAGGAIKQTVFDAEEFRLNFVEPFLIAARHCGFPRGADWLYLGPGGPHIIGRAARAIARALDSAEPFTVDCDPRWFRKLAPGSLARERYLQHQLEQALRHLQRERIDVLFLTPVILESLILSLTTDQRDRIRGVHYGGMCMSAGQYRFFRQTFRNAVHLSGYGNSMFGCCPEIPQDRERSKLTYFPARNSWVVQLIDPAFDPARAEAPRLVSPGERGRVLAHRFSRQFLIVNLLERDEAQCIEADRVARELGFCALGLADPQPLHETAARQDRGIY